MSRVTITGMQEINANMDAYGDKIVRALKLIADYFAPVLETYAKENAPWRDRTANARQGLQGFSQQMSEEVVRLYLTHGMDYGIYLETRWAGRYAVLIPTLEAHLPQIKRMVEETFR